MSGIQQKNIFLIVKMLQIFRMSTADLSRILICQKIMMKTVCQGLKYAIIHTIVFYNGGVYLYILYSKDSLKYYDYNTTI